MSSAKSLVRRCTELVRGRRVVLVGGVLAGATPRVRQLRSFGAAEVLVVAQGLGTGPLPLPDEAQVEVIDGPPLRRVSDEVAASVAFAADPPAAAREAVHRFDPDQAALCLLGPFATAGSYCGRETLGGRPERFAALEDKTTCDPMWDAAGVTRTASEVVPAQLDALLAASARLDVGHGTVWSGDASGGVNGGGDSVRWVRNRDEGVAAVKWLDQHSRLVRVMSFLEGVPCSIHGFVLPDGVAVFRPVELLVLREGEGPRFVYAGISTCWEPSAVDREQMRSVARRVGLLLAAQVGYRGGFSVDGVLTAQGFRPTELNPRFAAGLTTIAKGVPELPLELLQAATVHGVDLGWTAATLEGLLLPAADASPYASAHATREVSAKARPGGTVSVHVTGHASGLSLAEPGQEVVGTLECGPASVGLLVRYLPASVTPGPRFAPYAAAALALADRLWGTGFGPLQAAPDVRSAPPLRPDAP